MDVLQIVPNGFFRMSSIGGTNDHVSGGSHADLVCDVTWKSKMAFCPRNLNLDRVSKFQHS